MAGKRASSAVCHVGIKTERRVRLTLAARLEQPLRHFLGAHGFVASISSVCHVDSGLYEAGKTPGAEGQQKRPEADSFVALACQVDGSHPMHSNVALITAAKLDAALFFQPMMPQSTGKNVSAPTQPAWILEKYRSSAET